MLFFVNLVTYVGYLACLTAYVMEDYPGMQYMNGCHAHINESETDADWSAASESNSTGKMLQVEEVDVVSRFYRASYASAVLGLSLIHILTLPTILRV